MLRWNPRTAFSQAIAAMALAAALICGAPAHAPAQDAPGDPFTVEDLLRLVTTRVAAMTDDGQWLAMTEATRADRIGIDNTRYGDPTYVAPSVADVFVVNIETGEREALFDYKRQVSGLSWSPDGDVLAMRVLEGESYQPRFWSRTRGWLPTHDLTGALHLDSGGGFQWMPDGKTVLISARTSDWLLECRDRFTELTEGPVVVLSSDDPFLAWEELRAMRSVRSLVWLDIETGETRELMPESAVSSYSLSEDGKYLRYAEDLTEGTDYARIGGRNANLKLLALEAEDAEPRTLFENMQGVSITWSGDGLSYAFTREGDIFFAGVEDAEPRRLTGEDEAEPGEESDEASDEEKDEEEDRERFRIVRVNRAGTELIASSDKGLYLMDTGGGERELFHAAPDEADEATAPRYAVTAWSEDGNDVYLTYASRTEWERGLYVYDRRAGELEELARDGRQYSGFRLSRDGSRMIFSMNEAGRPAETYKADGRMNDVEPLTGANPWLAGRAISRPELVKYLDADGREMNGVLYYPANYEPGEKVPTIFLIYETFFDPRFNATTNVLTSAGYAVMQPSVRLETGFPGEAWLKGVTAAANKLIEMGIADADRLGVQGTSYGGYAVNLLITQTGRFKAAINVSGKVNMISFYTDSPRLGTRNIHAPERSQDRLGASLWEQPQKYIAHSAIMFADRIETPLLLITGAQDHNVPARQAMEMYYAMRRLGKEVTWVNYMNGGHGMPTTTVDEIRDYHARILDWYAERLAAAEEGDDR